MTSYEIAYGIVAENKQRVCNIIAILSNSHLMLAVLDTDDRVIECDGNLAAIKLPFAKFMDINKICSAVDQILQKANNIEDLIRE